jgi:hypothetical protein
VTEPLTQVSLVFIPGQMNVYLGFGQPLGQRYLNGRCRSVFFRPDQTFCRVWREGNEYGLTRCELAILQARAPRQFVQKVTGITPGASILLRVEGEPTVQLVQRLISTIRARGIEPDRVSTRFWRVVQNRLAARLECPTYTPFRHRAQLTRETALCAEETS